MSKIRVLFIEDEIEFVKDLSAILGAEGFEVAATTDIAEAMRLFASQDFDVVLTDIAMPPGKDMDEKAVMYGRETGIEVIKRIRALKPHVPIVVLTVIRDQEIVSSIRKAGVRQILHKPQEVKQIVEALKKVH